VASAAACRTGGLPLFTPLLYNPLTAPSPLHIARLCVCRTVVRPRAS
jgi:hypothetical protein